MKKDSKELVTDKKKLKLQCEICEVYFSAELEASYCITS